MGIALAARVEVGEKTKMRLQGLILCSYLSSRLLCNQILFLINIMVMRTI